MAETKRRIIVDGIDFRQLFQFPKLFRAVPLSFSPPRLLLALLMIVILALAGSIWDAATAHRENGEPVRAVTVVHGTGHGAFEASVNHVLGSVERLVRSVLQLNGLEAGRAVADVVFWMPLELWSSFPFFTIIFGIIFLFVAAIGGGAISRMTAAEIAGIERLRMIDALHFSATRWLRLMVATALPLLVVAFLGLMIAILGTLTNVPFLDLIPAVLYGFALMLGFVIAALLLGYVGAGPMIIPAISCENCDVADAMQRSYAYVFSRPLHLLGYWIVTAVALALGFLLVSLFAWAILNTTGAMFGAWTRSFAANTAGGYPLFELFARPEHPQAQDLTEVILQWFIAFWETLVLALVAAFVFAFAFSAATILYLLMRRASDGQSLDEIWRPGLVPGSLARMPQVDGKADND